MEIRVAPLVNSTPSMLKIGPSRREREHNRRSSLSLSLYPLLTDIEAFRRSLSQRRTHRWPGFGSLSKQHRSPATLPPFVARGRLKQGNEVVGQCMFLLCDSSHSLHHESSLHSRRIEKSVNCIYTRWREPFAVVVVMPCFLPLVRRPNQPVSPYARLG